MAKKIMTLKSLYAYYKAQNKSCTFSTKASGTPIVVYTDGVVSVDKNPIDGMLMTVVKVCHTLENRNQSFVSQETMEKAMPSLKYRPILAYIHKLDDGSYDFHSHDMDIVEDENGDAQINYIEQQVGCITADEPWMEHDDRNDRDYVMAYAVIPEDYTMAADIIRAKSGTTVSCEMIINDLEYDADKDVLNILDFYFGGVTLLGAETDGTQVEPGMEGARMDIVDFCAKPTDLNIQDKLVEALNKLNETLQVFTINNDNLKGGVGEMDFAEIAAKYNLTMEDIDFDYSAMTAEEFKAELMARCGSGKDDEDEKKKNNAEEIVWVCAECGYEVTASEQPTECPECDSTEFTKKKDSAEENTKDATDEQVVEQNSKKLKYVHNEDDSCTVTFELSHEDIVGQLYGLLYQDENYDDAYICAVYDSYFVACDWETGSMTKQAYTKENDVVALTGEKTPVYVEYLTAEEKAELDAMRSEYNELKEFKSITEAAQSAVQKDAVLDAPEFECIADSAEFVALKKDKAKFSVDEIETKAKVIFANYTIKNKEHQPMQKVGVASPKPKKAQAYAGLFDE